VKAVEVNNTSKYSGIVKINVQKENAEMTVYPNPVKDKVVSVQMVNQPKGVYVVQIINNLGR